MNSHSHRPARRKEWPFFAKSPEVTLVSVVRDSIAQISTLQKIVRFSFFIGIGCACVKGSRVVQDSGYYGRAPSSIYSWSIEPLSLLHSKLEFE